MKILLTVLIFINSLSCAKATNLLKELCVNLDWIQNVEYAGIFLAQEYGYYKEQGLKVTTIQRSSFKDDLTKKTLTGKCDIGIHVGSSVLTKRIEGKDIKAFAATLQMSPITILSFANKDINELRKLKGRRFGYYTDTDLDILEILFKENNLSIADIKKIQIKVAYDVLIKDQVDALFAYEFNQPVIFGLEGKPVNLIYAYKHGFIFYGSVFFAADDFINKNAELLASFLKATFKGWKKAFQEIEKTAKLVVDKYYPKDFYVKENKDFTLKHQKVQLRLLYQYMTNGVGLDKMGFMTRYTWQKGIDLYKKHGLLKKNISVDDLMTLKVLKILYPDV